MGQTFLQMEEGNYVCIKTDLRDDKPNLIKQERTINPNETSTEDYKFADAIEMPQEELLKAGIVEKGGFKLSD